MCSAARLQEKQITTADSAPIVSENQAACLCASSNEFRKRRGLILNLTPFSPRAADKKIADIGTAPAVSRFEIEAIGRNAVKQLAYLPRLVAAPNGFG
jgi:hypothetical protein